MLNLFQHLVCFFLPLADAPFIPVHRAGFSGAILINGHAEPNVCAPSFFIRLSYRVAPHDVHLLIEFILL